MTNILDFEGFEVEDIPSSTIIIKTLLQNIDSTDTLVVSLSGGVDSMVITKALIHMKKKLLISNKLVTVHINYRNRSESDEEADFVEKWCGKYAIQCFRRDIDEVRRTTTPRALYETEARKIRFDFYKKVCKTVKANSVIFGHHRDDIQENVVSNVMKGVGLTKLSGMQMKSTIDSVQIVRPLLKLPKQEIYNFAHTFGIPYFKDSTPKWSVRGKLRDTVLPSLKMTYGANVGNKLLSLAKRSDELKYLLETMVFEPFRDKCILRNEDRVKIIFVNHMHLGEIFWKEILDYECGMMKIKSISTKSLQILIHKLGSKCNQNVMLNKQLKSYIEDTSFTLIKIQ